MLQCGFYEKEITPPLGADIPGYFMKRPSTGVLDRLYAKAFAVSDGTTSAVLIEIDAVELPVKNRDAITAHIHAMTGLAPEHVAVCATHTHYGIPAGEPFGSEEDVPFMTEFCRLAADCAALALRQIQPCTLSFGVGSVDGMSFNRDYLMADGSVRTNPSDVPVSEIVRHYAENDPELPVLYAANADGQPLGALIGFACHQDCIGGTQYSGDFSSELSRRLKARYGADFVSVYLAAPSGDINHLDFMTGHATDYRELGCILAAEAAHVIASAAQPVAYARVQTQMQRIRCRYRRADAETLRRAEQIAAGGPDNGHNMLGTLQAELLVAYERKATAAHWYEGELPVQVFLIGDLPVFIMPGELYHQFGHTLKDACGGRCLIATLSNGFFGYIPVPELFGTDVYPVQLCEGSMWQPEAGAMLTDCAIKMLQHMMEEETC